MGSKRKSTDMSANNDQIKIVAPVGEDGVVADGAEGAGALTEEKAVKKKASRVRSKKYVAVRAQIDKTKKYDPFAAVELVKKLSYTKFDGTITAHVVVREAGLTASLTFPHSTGRAVRVMIVTEEVLKDIGEGKIEFDVLVSHPQFMPKLAKFAPVLGPKGLMPNPKNGTLTPNPELQKKKLEAGAMTLKTEKKAPLIHVSIGKTSVETKKLVENIEALMKSLSSQMIGLTIAASMSPGVKVEVAK